ncbi:Hypothetical predicted protein [Cloeon dipterum]|uniref:Uncharacterized protein n=1 Tax=Cloeon dipterum TaxID=197152 RepID=A0A8S1DRD7_9INSE|nr:Hypothetical predicted protein [Cloeon dipterum]
MKATREAKTEKLDSPVSGRVEGRRFEMKLLRLEAVAAVLLPSLSVRNDNELGCEAALVPLSSSESAVFAAGRAICQIKSTLSLTLSLGGRLPAYPLDGCAGSALPPSCCPPAPTALTHAPFRAQVNSRLMPPPPLAATSSPISSLQMPPRLEGAQRPFS